MIATPQDTKHWLTGCRFVVVHAGRRLAYAPTAEHARRIAGPAGQLYALVPHATRDDRVYVTLAALNPSSGAKQRARGVRAYTPPLSDEYARQHVHPRMTATAERFRKAAAETVRQRGRSGKPIRPSRLADYASSATYTDQAKFARPALPNPGHVWRLMLDYGQSEDWAGATTQDAIAACQARWRKDTRGGYVPEILSVDNVTRNPGGAKQRAHGVRRYDKHDGVAPFSVPPGWHSAKLAEAGIYRRRAAGLAPFPRESVRVVRRSLLDASRSSLGEAKRHRATGPLLPNPSHRELTAQDDERRAAEWAASGEPEAHYEVAYLTAGAAYERAADHAERLERKMGRHAPDVKAAKSAARRAFKAYLAAMQVHGEFCNRLCQERIAKQSATRNPAPRQTKQAVDGAIGHYLNYGVAEHVARIVDVKREPGNEVWVLMSNSEMFCLRVPARDPSYLYDVLQPYRRPLRNPRGGRC